MKQTAGARRPLNILLESEKLVTQAADLNMSGLDGHGPFIPEGYLLTIRMLKYPYLYDGQMCPNKEHVHPEHTVFWPASSSASITIGSTRHSLVKGHGLWVPAGTPHHGIDDPSTTMVALFILPAAWKQPVSDVRSVTVNTALREMLIYLDFTGMPRLQRLRAQRVCLEMIDIGTQPLPELRLPTDPRIVAIARSLLRDPTNNRSLEDWAWSTSMSTRTIARAFREDTGLTFTQWRTRARMNVAVELLADDIPAGHVARRVGYTNFSAFSAAFRRSTGRSPQDFRPTLVTR